MYRSFQADYYGNQSYQYYLASNLVRSLDYKDAIRVCRHNHWGETLSYIRRGDFNITCH